MENKEKFVDVWEEHKKSHAREKELFSIGERVARLICEEGIYIGEVVAVLDFAKSILLATTKVNPLSLK